MLKKSAIVVVFASILAGTGQCYAAGLQNQPSGDRALPAKLMDALKESKAKNRRLTIKLKNGQVFVGRVSQVSNKDFVLIPAPRSGYVGPTAIQYANVANFKEQSAAAKVFADIGDTTLTVLKWTGIGVGVAAAMPLVIPLFLVLRILGDLSSC
jgi:hypothetical protein